MGRLEYQAHASRSNPVCSSGSLYFLRQDIGSFVELPLGFHCKQKTQDREQISDRQIADKVQCTTGLRHHLVRFALASLW